MQSTIAGYDDFKKQTLIENADRFMWAQATTSKETMYDKNQCRDILQYPDKEYNLVYIMKNPTSLNLLNVDTMQLREVYISEKPISRIIMMKNGHLIIGTNSGSIIKLFEQDAGLYKEDKLIDVSDFHQSQKNT